jgi:hypothetical protein
MRPYLENTQPKKRAGRVTQVVEHQREALSSNPGIEKKNGFF